MQKYIKKIKKKIKSSGKKIYGKFHAVDSGRYRKEPVVKNRIVIATNTFSYTCNPKYIYEELIRIRDDLDIYWIVKDKKKAKEVFPEEAKLVELGSRECEKIVYSAHIWLNNGIVFSNYFDKKPEQVYLQTMHGSLGIKRLDNAVLGREAKGEEGKRVVQREEQNTDIVFTNSEFEEQVFRSVFWHDTTMERLGHARTDILFSEHHGDDIKRIRKVLKAKYQIPEDKKLVLYAPTHRRGLTAELLDIDYPLLCRTLSERFGGDFVVLFRLHNKSLKLLKNLKKSFASGIFVSGEYEFLGESTESFWNLAEEKKGAYQYTVVACKDIGTKQECDKTRITSVICEASGIRITWTSSEQAEKYLVYQKKEDGEWILRRTFVQVYEYLDTSVREPGIYSFKVVAADKDGHPVSGEEESRSVYYRSIVISSNDADTGSHMVKWEKEDEEERYRIYRRRSCEIRNLTAYPDIQELMLVSDVGITDYSSWIFDYVNTRRPGFLYVPDVDQYNSRTGLAYLLEETPFSVCEDNKDLEEAILQFDENAYVERVERFLADKQAVDDGHSAERIAKRIGEIIDS